jgi:hypothetical protein
MKAKKLSQHSVRLRTVQPGFDPRHRQRIFPLISVFRPALRPIQPHIHYPYLIPIGGPLSEVKRCRDVTLTTHPHLVPRLRISRSYVSLPVGTCLAVAGQPYFTKVKIQIVVFWIVTLCSLVSGCQKQS